VIPSGLHLELNRPYYVAASVRIGETGRQGVTFYLQDLSKDDAPLQTAQVEHRNAGGYRGRFDFVLGGRDGASHSGWDGLIDDARLTAAALAADELLIHGGATHEQTVGFWRFDAGAAFTQDASVHGNDIDLRSKEQAALSDPEVAALVDFCHVLLNSNEFIYVD
jgi:hypothetical protein